MCSCSLIFFGIPGSLAKSRNEVVSSKGRLFLAHRHPAVDTDE